MPVCCIKRDMLIAANKAAAAQQRSAPVTPGIINVRQYVKPK